LSKFTYLPAATGFCYLLPLKDEHGKFNGKFSRIPIVAWKIEEGEALASPISMDGGIDDLAMCAPGDVYITDFDAWYDSLDEYADHLRGMEKLRDK
jgi:hypothetical protein